MRLLLITILLFKLSSLNACECPEFEHTGKHVKRFFNSHGKVFIGNLIENKGGIYKFEVIKGFKNCEFRDILWGKYNNSCSITPKENGLWIVYASIQDSTSNEIDIDGCNSTRNLNSNRQSLYNGYDTNSDSYNLKEEQAGKLIELSILERLTSDHSLNKELSAMEDLSKSEFSKLKKQLKMNRINEIAIILSIIAILLNIQTRFKASRQQCTKRPFVG